jgi:hypothetical protein
MTSGWAQSTIKSSLQLLLVCVSTQGGSVPPEAAAVLADLQRRGALQVRFCDANHCQSVGPSTRLV